jgi:hypothetical protein
MIRSWIGVDEYVAYVCLVVRLMHFPHTSSPFCFTLSAVIVEDLQFFAQKLIVTGTY